MNIDLFWLHASILAIGAVIAYAMYMRTMRLKASFDLYRTRDKLVLLVASGALDEEGPLFRHYYSRINDLLRAAPNVGIDDMLQVVLHKFKPEDFKRMMAKSEDQLKKLMASAEFKNPDVRTAVSDYYSAIRSMILSHSSIMRAAYILSRHTADKVIARVLPAPLSRGLEAVDYTEREARLINV